MQSQCIDSWVSGNKIRANGFENWHVRRMAEDASDDVNIELAKGRWDHVASFLFPLLEAKDMLMF